MISKLVSIQLYTEKLLSVEDSPRTRSACLKLLQRWAIYFYPERMDLFGSLQLLAGNFGGRLDTPRLRMKYRWIQRLLGWKIAKKAQFTLPGIRSMALRALQRL